MLCITVQSLKLICLIFHMNFYYKLTTLTISIYLFFRLRCCWFWCEKAENFLRWFIGLIAQNDSFVNTMDARNDFFNFTEIHTMSSDFNLGITTTFVIKQSIVTSETNVISSSIENTIGAVWRWGFYLREQKPLFKCSQQQFMLVTVSF